MNDLNEAFKDAAQVYADRLKAQKEAAENKRKTTAANGTAFEEHIQKLLAKQREESSIADLLN